MKKLSLLLILLFFPLMAFEPHPVTPYPVLGYQEVSFFDKLQNVERQLLIWYPVDPVEKGTPSTYAWDVFNLAVNAQIQKSNVKRPLIIVSHGYTGNPHQLSWLILKLVHEGFIVAAIHHRDLVDGKAHLNLWRRPQDISTVIDQFTLQKISKNADLDKIGLAGFSLGGSTAIWVAGGISSKLDKIIPDFTFANDEDFTKADEALMNIDRSKLSESWKETRVKAIFAMAPAWSWIFDAKSLKNIAIPAYIIAAEKDKVLVTKKNAGYFAENIPHSIYQTIPGRADHFIFATALSPQQKKLISPHGEYNFVIVDDPSIDRQWIQFQVAEEADRFFNFVFKQ